MYGKKLRLDGRIYRWGIIMIKHRYKVSGISTTGDFLFSGSCVSDDIIKAIQLFR